MNREKLKELGLTDEQVESVIALHGASVHGMNTKISELQTSENALKQQIAERDKDLKNLKSQLDDNEESKGKFAELQKQYLFQDEHSTATDGLYELRESLLNEFKYGTHNWNYRKFFPPLFPKIKNVDVQFCESKKNRLIRCADIIANRVYYCAVNNKIVELRNKVFLSFTLNEKP